MAGQNGPEKNTGPHLHPLCTAALLLRRQVEGGKADSGRDASRPYGKPRRVRADKVGRRRLIGLAHDVRIQG